MQKTIDTKLIRDRYDLREFVASDLGTHPDKKIMGTHFFKSPFRTERTASFAVYPDHFFDYGNAPIKSGDIFSYVEHRRNISFIEAAEFLQNGSETWKRTDLKTPDQRRPEFINDKDFPKVEAFTHYMRSYDLVKPYMVSRGFTNEKVLKSNIVGGYRYRKTYIDRFGDEYIFECNRVALPYVFNGQVISVNHRRDDLSAMEFINRPGNAYKLDIVRKDIAFKKEIPEDQVDYEDLMSEAFGLRYYKPPEIRTGVYGLDQIMKRNGDSYSRYKLSYVILTEGELNALILQCLGFRGLAAKKSNRYDLESILWNVEIIYVQIENDSRMGPRGLEHPGLEYGKSILQAVGSLKDRVRFINIQSPFKDFDDMAIVGKLTHLLTSHPYYLEPMI